MYLFCIYLYICFISHPSDEKDHSSFSKTISAANMATLTDRQYGQSEPSVNVTNHREADGEKNKVKRKTDINSLVSPVQHKQVKV